MNNFKSLLEALSGFLIIILLCAICSCMDNKPAGNEPVIQESIKPAVAQEVIWHIKAIHPNGKMIDVKALDKEGKIHDVKAIVESGNLSLFDIKAFIGEKRLPVKVIASNDKYNPIKAIGDDGTIYDIKAITTADEKLDVKGISTNGKIVNIKAVTKQGELYGIKAISPNGQFYDVKGIKMTNDKVEMKVNGVDVYAHIKAIPQRNGPNTDSIWHIKAIHPDGKILDVKAIDKVVKIFAKGANSNSFISNGIWKAGYNRSCIW